MPEKMENSALPLMEAFYTIQGEGYHTGSAAYFIRLAGCDVGCVWCDVKDSWEADKYPVISVSEMTGQAKKTPAEIAVITGGEPLMYDLSKLTVELKAKGLKRHIETAGVYPITGEWDWVCFSPKKFKAPLDEYYEASHELKIVIYNKADFAWAESHAAKTKAGMVLLLQPEWSKREQLMPLIVDYVKHNPKWKISLQTHKYLNIP